MIKPTIIPHQKPSKPFPAWRLPNGIIKANDEELEESIGSCERWEWFGGALVIAGVAASIAIAAIHPRYDSMLEQWGSVLAESCVAIGVVIEIKLGQMAGLRHADLKRRSDENVAKANKIAAQANKEASAARERTAEIERITAGRRISPELRENIVKAFSNKEALIELAIEFQNGDSEAFSYARDLAQLFTELGNKRILFQSNSHLMMTVFATAVRLGISEHSDELSRACAEAFGINVVPEDLRSVFGHGFSPLPNLYLFVGPKPPQSFSLSPAEQS